MVMSMKRLILLFLVSAQLSYSQEWVPPENETPDSLFEFTIGDDEVEFFLLGSWVVNLGYGFHYSTRASDGEVIPRYMPGFISGLIWNSEPDIALSIEYMKKFFLSVTFGEENEFQEYILGYKGGDDDVIQDIIIGNADLGALSLPFITIPEAGKNSFGAKINLQAGKGKHSIFLRSDDFGWVKEKYQGMSRIEQNFIPADFYKTGQFFILPDTDFTDLRLYIEDNAGSLTGSDSKKYRKLLASEAAVSIPEGWIYLHTPAGSRVLVYYTKEGLEIGDAGLGINAIPDETGDVINPSLPARDFKWPVIIDGNAASSYLQVSIEGNNALLLSQPGYISRFESFNSYDAGEVLSPQTTESYAEFVQTGLQSGDRAAFIQIKDTVFAFFPESDSIRDITARYPLSSVGDFYPFAPGNSADSYELALTSLYRQNTITIQGTAVPGSLLVKRNGQVVNDYQFNGSEIVFIKPVKESDSIEIKYQMQGSSDVYKYLIAAFQSDFDLTDSDTLYASGALQWNTGSTGFSEAGFQSPGSFTFASGYSHSSDSFNFTIDAGFSLSNPDTAGLYRIFAMNGEDSYIPLTYKNISPASEPGTVPSIPPIIPVLNRTNRGRLRFSDYTFTSSNGSKTLIPFDSTIPAENTAPYAEGEPSGPYLASGVTAKQGNVAVADYELNGTEIWAGFSVEPGNEKLLQSAEKFTFSIFQEGTDTDLRFFIQFGAIAEDRDGDSILDSEDSQYSDGYIFNDNVSSLALTFGDKDNYGLVQHTEDANGNGILDEESPAKVFTEEITPVSESWKEITLIFNESQRRILSYSPQIRIIVVNEGAAVRTGRLILADVKYNGSRMDITVPSGTAAVYDQNDNSDVLQQSFPDSPFFEKSDNSFTTIKWSGTTSGDTITAEAFIPPVIPDTYKQTGFYIKNTNGAAGISIEAAAYSGASLVFSYTFNLPADTDWHNVEYSLTENTLSIDGASAALLDSSIHLFHSEIDRITLKIQDSISTDGDVALDELYFSHSKISLAAGISQNLDWNIENAEVIINNFPIIDDLSVHQSSTFTTANFSPGFYGAPPFYEFHSNTGLSLTLLGILLDLNAGIQYSAFAWQADGNMEIIIPFADIFTISDTYGTTGGSIKTATHTTAVNLTIPGVLIFDTDHFASAGNSKFNQKWNTVLSSNWTIPVTVKFGADWQNSADDPEKIISTFFQGYAVTYPLIIPEYPVISSRAVNFSIEFSAAINDISISWLPEYHLLRSQTQVDTALIAGSGTISIPLTIQKNSPQSSTITFEYSRYFDVQTVSASSNLGDDTALLWNNIFSNSFIFTEIPFYEFFAEPDISLKSGEQQKVYAPKITVNYSRHFGSYLLDFFLPSSLSFSAENKYEYFPFGSIKTLTLTGSAGINSINLFGSKGAYKLFTFFESDEYYANFSLNSIIQGDEYTFSWVLTNNIKILINDEAYFLIDNMLERKENNTITDQADIYFQWQHELTDTDKIPILKDITEKKLLINNENISFLYFNEEFKKGWSLTAGHSTELQIIDIFKLIAYIKIGYQSITFTYPDYNETERTFAGEIGLSGKISF